MATPAQERCTALHALTDAVPTFSMFSSAQSIANAARTIQMYYEAPVPTEYVQLCQAARVWQTPDGRIKLLKLIASWGASKGFLNYGLGPVVTYPVVRVLNDARNSVYGNPETNVAYEATVVVTSARDSALDAATWLPLWQLALGGAQGQASVRTRVGAMKAVQAILRRGTLLPGQIRAADSLAAVLRSQVAARAPSVNAAERDYFLSEAEATVGAAAAALAAAEIAVATGGGNMPVPPSTWTTMPSMPSWVMPVAAGVVALTVGVAVVAVVSRRRTAA